MAKPMIRGRQLLSVALAVKLALAPVALLAGESAEEGVDIELPGVVVLGERTRDVQRAATEVLTVLSDEDLARMGEGDIAGALARVTGLSVVGGGFVYVRGLGDRYSLAMLNGLPLPSPEPLRRAVPLDLFPTDIVASTLVQKTYSPNFPGEFGGGVINLTTLAIPRTPFLKFGASFGGNTETTGRLGYDYYGGKHDWSGFDGGARDKPAALAGFLGGGQRITALTLDERKDIASELVSWRNGLVQQMGETPANYSASLTGGTAWTMADGSQLGVIGTAGFSNKWRTRDNLQQTSASIDLSELYSDYRAVSTENRAVANALLGFGYEFGEGQRLRWTNLYIHDTLKRTSIAGGSDPQQRLGWDMRRQGTGWYERQLFSTQMTGGFNLLDNLGANLRGSYSRSRRDAPYELDIGYARTNLEADPYGTHFVNRLDNGQRGYAEVSFSELDEELRSAGVDLVLRMGPRLALTTGYDITDTHRDSTYRGFQVIAPSDFPSAVAMFRPDHLLSPAVIDYYNFNLVETTESAPAFTARLLTRAAYAQAQAELGMNWNLGMGVRFERGLQTVAPLQIFNTQAGESVAPTRIVKDYWLPSATLTWKLSDNQQLRFNASRTVARPQFRELMFQRYFDIEAGRALFGNPLMTDSKFLNAETRYEWYFASEQRLSLSGFYKKIDRPIEAYATFDDARPFYSYANAPSADLYGAEMELQKYFPLYNLTENSFFGVRRTVLSGNYTYSRSRLKVRDGDTVAIYGSALLPASNVFAHGAPLTGQSDHLINLQLGLEHPDQLSQQTLMFSYASDRVSSRGAGGLPDLYESPGLTVDFVARQGFDLFGRGTELKFEARNLLGRGYKEFQRRSGNTVFYNKYEVGTSLSLSLSMNF